MEKVVKNFYKNKKVFVTGATGFKGAWLCSWLNMLGANVYGTGYNPNKNKNLFYKLKLNKKIKLKIFDIRDYNKLSRFIKETKPRIIFHLAAQPIIFESYKKPYSTIDINCRGTLNILEIAKSFNFVKSVVCITSDKCYENKNSNKGFKETDRLGGVDPYSASKASAEIIIKAYNESFFKKSNRCGVASARAGNVIGGGDWSPNRLIPDCVRSILKNKVIYIRNPNFNRPWQLVLEPLKGYLLLAKKLYDAPSQYSGAWNFGTVPNSITNVKQIVYMIVNFWGKGKIKIKKEKKYYEQFNLQLDISKSKKFLKWQPTYTIAKSVSFTAAWYKKVLVDKTKPETVTNDQIKKYMYDSNWS